MKVLVVKLTSMGDAIHVLPALSDLAEHVPSVEVDWMIEKSFVEIPAWHPMVKRVIPVSTRQWRRPRLSSATEFWRFLKSVRETRYDVIIDAQGLMKSAIFARFARLTTHGVRAGFSADSIKERPAARLYQKKIPVARGQHAIERLRSLFAQTFGYSVDPSVFDYRLAPADAPNPNQLMFFHGTTWPSKHLPDDRWLELIKLVTAQGYRVLLPWGNQAERHRAERLSAGHSSVDVLPKCNLTDLKRHLSETQGAIAVDTGLGHLAAALGVPCVSIYGSTNASLTGAVGENQLHMQTPYACSPCLLKECDKISDEGAPPPCYATVTAEQIWRSLRSLMLT